MGFNCHFHMDFQPFIDAFLAHKQVVLSYALAFIIASPATLRYWLAVQQATDVPAVSAKAADKMKKQMSKAKIARSIAIRMAISGAIVYALFNLPIDGVKVMTGILTGLPAFICILSMSTTVQRNFPKFSVFRSPAGLPVQVASRTKLSKLEKAGILLRVVFSAAVATTTVLHFEASSVLAATAISYCVVRGSSMNFSIRTYYKLVAALTTLSFALTGILVAVIIHFHKDQSATEQPAEEDTTLLQVLHDWTNWYLPAIHAFGPGVLISASLRFDYQNYLDALPEGDEAPVQFETVPRPEPQVRKSGRCRRFVRRVVGETGIVIPVSLPRFAPIYFSVAFFLWAFAYGGMIYLEAYTSLVFKDNYEYSSCSLLVSLPIMCIGMWVLALLRGEFRKFWTYKEQWHLPAKPPLASSQPSLAVVAPVETDEKAEATEVKEDVLVEV